MTARHSSITILGLGRMGRPMARTLQAAGWQVRGWNRSALEPLQISGLHLCANLQEAARSDICLLMLRDSDAVDEVLTHLEPHVQEGQLVLDMGSSEPWRSQLHARRLAERGIGWVDAPVSGGPEAADAGSLTVMVGGAAPHAKRVWSLLLTLGQHVVHVGPAGAGHTMKILNQLIVGLTIEAVAEALALAERLELPPTIVLEALRGGFADSKVLQIHGARMAMRTYIPGAAAHIQLKDLEMAAKLAQQVGLYLPHLQSTCALYQQLVAQGDGDLDHAALHKLL